MSKNVHSLKMERFLRVVLTALFVSYVTSTIVIHKSEGDEIAFKPIKPFKQLIAHKQHVLSKFKPANHTSNNRNEATPTPSSNNSPVVQSNPSPSTTPRTTSTTYTSNTPNNIPATNSTPSMNQSNPLSTDIETENDKTTSTNTSLTTLRVGQSELLKQSPFDPSNYPSFIYPYPYMPPISNNLPQIPHNIILIPVPFPPPA